MMKKILMGLVLFSSIYSFAGEYSCSKNEGAETDLGEITFIGDPLGVEVQSITIKNKEMLFRQSELDNAYIYLKKDESSREHIALEVVSYDSDQEFELSVFARKRGILGVTSLFRISRYTCLIK